LGQNNNNNNNRRDKEIIMMMMMMIIIIIIRFALWLGYKPTTTELSHFVQYRTSGCVQNGSGAHPASYPMGKAAGTRS
jgi:hypothetical protein